MKNLFYNSYLILIGLLVFSCKTESPKSSIKSISDLSEIEISKTELLNKIKGGWAGQVIGCTYGGPTEFKWNGTMIDDYVSIPWDDTRMLWYYENVPGLYDDIYMDITFVDVFSKYGIDAPDSLHALAFAHADYPLWHANQAARYNILNGIMPPESGYWKNNPHADDIDFQIEADFAGLMSPGMINSALDISNRIGRIMNYGDGLYGGMYIAAMYSLAFVYNDIEFIVTEALKVIPEQSDFYQCIADVLKSYKNNPDDWKFAWFEAQKKWTHDKGCPDGVFNPFNIDAKINAAYIVIGLLYGKGDYGATIDISTRCGYDSDCNPANAAGILGTMMGYDIIPDYWKLGLDKVEDMDFQFTEMSLNRLYEEGLNQALEMIKRNGGEVDNDMVKIIYQAPKTVPLEIGFEGLYPIDRVGVNKRLSQSQNEINIEFTGSAFVLTGYASFDGNQEDAILELELYINDTLVETIKMPTLSLIRRHDVAWNYDLNEGDHKITLKPKNIPDNYYINVREIITYSNNEPKPNVYF